MLLYRPILVQLCRKLRHIRSRCGMDFQAIRIVGMVRRFGVRKTSCLVCADRVKGVMYFNCFGINLVGYEIKFGACWEVFFTQKTIGVCDLWFFFVFLFNDN